MMDMLIQSLFLLVANQSIEAIRKNIFTKNKNEKTFSMVNEENKQYTGIYRYVCCSREVTNQFKQLGMLPDEACLNESLQSDKYARHLIIKRSNKGRSWIMFHLQKVG
jgi:hypothetical protein